MRNKLLLLTFLLLLSGLVYAKGPEVLYYAEQLGTSDSQGYWVGTSTANVRMGITNICHHHWQKSNWFLEHEYTEAEKQCMALLMTNCQHAVLKVEICSKCGLIRIDPKEKK